MRMIVRVFYFCVCVIIKYYLICVVNEVFSFGIWFLRRMSKGFNFYIL